MFHDRLRALLEKAVERKLVTPDAAAALRTLAEEEVKDRGTLTLASVLGWLGGGAVALGVILLIGANWNGIPNSLKLGGFLTLLGGTHALGFWITRRGLPYERTAASLHFLGGGLFLGGIGLVAQIYHLSGRPPNGILLWLGSLVPLVVLLRSSSLALLAVFAGVLWIHLEAVQSGSPLRMEESFALHLILELALGVGLVGLAARVGRWDSGVAKVLRGSGILMLFVSVYTLGFYRYFAGEHGWSRSHEVGSGLLPGCVLGLGAVGLAAGARLFSPESPWLRHRLWILLGATLLLGLGVAGVELGLVAPGERMERHDFGGWLSYSLAGWVLTVLAWAVWFLIALWSIAWGARSDRKAFVNLGVLSVGLGVITRFFDLVGTQTQSGTLFIVGGAFLLGTAFGMEKWRRSIVKKMQAKKAGA